MDIKVLGTGCAGCKALHNTVLETVAKLGLDTNVEKVEDLMEIMNYNVLSMPGLVIDGKVVSSGKKLSATQVEEYLTK